MATLFALISHLEISVAVFRLRFIATATGNGTATENCVVCRPNVGQTIIDIYIYMYVCIKAGDNANRVINCDCSV